MQIFGGGRRCCIDALTSRGRGYLFVGGQDRGRSGAAGEQRPRDRDHTVHTDLGLTKRALGVLRSRTSSVEFALRH